MRWVILFPLLCSGLTAGRTIEFNRDVRPILSDKCFTCHGPDAVAKKIPLRLDSEAAAKRVIAPGDPAASLLVRRITAAPATRMPPQWSGLKLSDPEIETLKEWIAQGAKWEKHWSFLPPKRAPLPDVKDASWPRNAIDRFILARLEREGLKPSPEASRETLLRRVTLDLTGLPPTPAEIDAFLNDRSPNAYEKVVDRLLASPRYGERMAAPWLDAARYADSNGYQYDGERVMWRWRDWVIDAFNRNEPYDRFVLDQIAGDMLPKATVEQKIATGFNRNHRANTEDGIIPEEYAVEYVVDRVETTSAVFLGVTLGCARCHNHKYDPFTQKEFYQVFAYFNNVPELGRAMKYGNSPPLVAAPTAEQRRELDALDARIHEVEDFLRARQSATDAAERTWERKAEVGHWSPPDAVALQTKPMKGEPATRPGRVGQAWSFDGQVYLDAGQAGAFDIDDRFTLAAWIRPDAPDGAILSRMADNPRGRGYGVYLKGGKVHVHITSNYADDAIRVDTERSVTTGEWHHVAVTYTGSRMAEGIEVRIDGEPAKFKVELDTLYRPFRNAGRQFREPFRIGAGGGDKFRFRGLIDGVRVYARVLSELEIRALSLGEPVNTIARKPEAQRGEAERLAIRSYFVEHAAPAEIREASARLAALKLEREKLERTFPTVMVMAESPVPKETHLLIRGQYNRPGDKVQPGVPAVLPPLPPGAPNNRLGFGEWLVDPGNPLTARVAVNRFWQMLFGIGIVKTTEDFGVQGEWPVHPELLDWLATEFVRTGWDVERMLKLMVTSAAYRQSSRETPELIERDPENRLLARGPRFRLRADMIRDAALFEAGLLKERTGGPSVKPYQPEGLWKELAMQDMEYVRSQSDDLYRRSLYTFWKRTIAPPMMVNFDAANRESCVVRANRTNTPLQALNLMNDVTFVEAARFIGQRMMREGGLDAASRLRYGFRLVVGRAPLASEEEVLRGSLAWHLDYFSGKPDAVTRYLEQGDSRADPGLDRRELAAYASVASLLLNLDEAVSKE